MRQAGVEQLACRLQVPLNGARRADARLGVTAVDPERSLLVQGEQFRADSSGRTVQGEQFRADS